MSATEKLCQMLRERGIEHETAVGITTWPHSDGYTAEYDELLDGSDTRLIVYKATPEQAISATMGTCENVAKQPSNGGFWPWPHFECSECKAFYIASAYVHYCPSCGKRIVE